MAEQHGQGVASSSMEHESDHVVGPTNPIANAGSIVHSEMEVEGIHVDEGPDESAVLNLDVDYDNDSALGDMTPATSTMSIDSAVYDYVEENGRTYHRYKEGKYFLPNDEDEKDRLELQHQIWLISLDMSLHLAPVENPLHVLDIGTGTGIWAIEFAEKNPACQVIGTDLSPIQPQYAPPNCIFEVEDAEDEWTYHQQFDLIHGRALMTCFKDPRAVIQSAFNALRPGGYLELQDGVLPLRSIDESIHGTKLEEWTERCIGAAVNLGISFQHTEQYKRYFEEAGFVDVTERHFQWPTSPWAKGERMKMIGAYWQEDMSRGVEGMSMAVLTRGGGMTKDEVLELTNEVKKDLHNRNIHAYLPVIIVYGRKPVYDEL